MLETPSQILEHEASADAVAGFIDWRKSLKKPLTPRAASLVAKSLREITACGGDADEALDMTQERGWLTVKAAWYWNAKRQEQPQLRTINGGHNGQPANTHPQIDAIDVAARSIVSRYGDRSTR